MRQAIMTSPGQIEIRDVPEPACAPDQVLVRVRRIGICGSDVHVYHGTHPFTGYPVVQGHEFSGQIVQVGSAVDDPQLRPGVKVTCETQRTCRRCRPCRSGRYHLCDELRVMGFQTPGAAQELVALPAEKVIALPDAFSFDQGALMEPAAVGVHATARAGVNPGDCVLVIGAGPIGMMAALAARARSAATVLISEPSAARRQVARKLGFEQLIDPREQPLPESVRQALPDGPDVIIECVGTQASLSAALQAAAKGIRLVVVGVFPDPPRLDMARLVDWELDLLGSMMYRRQDWLQAVEWTANGQMPLASLADRHYPFDQYAEAYRWIDGHPAQAMKVMIDVDR